jgi:hypothetical protein
MPTPSARRQEEHTYVWSLWCSESWWADVIHVNVPLMLHCCDLDHWNAMVRVTTMQVRILEFQRRRRLGS